MMKPEVVLQVELHKTESEELSLAIFVGRTVCNIGSGEVDYDARMA